jgi:CRISPR-associated protein Csm1
MDIYQPHYQGKYTHKHAVYTAAFIDHIEKLMPAKFNKGEWGLDDSFMNLAAGHHKPETPMQWIIAMADRVSSGFDRNEFEDYNAESGENRKGIKIQDYKKTRLLTIFEGLSTGEEWKEDSLDAYRYRYPLKELSPQNIFPTDDSEVRQVESKQASTDYRDLFFSFIAALEKLEHMQNIPLWFEHFDSLFMIYASHIPAATVGYVVPDVSLYDHCRTTSALASALYLYHHETGTIDEDNIKNYEPKKFLLINGDFYGIQDFIFTEGGSTGKASAKLLRGRSFYVSLLSELAADMICRGIGLPVSSVILNAAGKFTILAPNTEKTRVIIRDAEEAINNWLVNRYYGEASMGISFIDASPEDFVSSKFSSLWERLLKEIDKHKYSKFDLSKYGGAVPDYLSAFDNTLSKPICPFCAKRPSAHDVESDPLLGDEKSSCRICRDHIYIGTNLVKEDKIAITTVDADLEREKLKEPLLGKYQVSFKVSGKLNDLSKSGTLLKYWNIGITEDGNLSKEITAKFINGYVPKYDDSDLYDDRYLAGKRSEKKKLELIEQIKVDKGNKTPKTFSHIAVKALNSETHAGTQALGILKADVDNLGLLFSCGFMEGRQTLSRLATLSRQLNNFFSIFLPYFLKTDNRFQDTYTVFAGGDDLFLIGPWNRIIELADLLNKEFRQYVCHNKDITISAGISVHKPGEPIMTIAESAEHALALSKSKNKDIKDKITVFGETVAWDEFKTLEGIKDTMQKWLVDETINNAMLFRFNELLEMAKQEKEIKDSKFNIQLEDMECLKWHARFKYTVVRNIGRHLKGDKKNEAIEEVSKTAEWLETYGGALKIPLWQIIYNQR